jgi:hypothetical protein
VISGCEVVSQQIRVKFNSSLLKGGSVDVRDYNKVTGQNGTESQGVLQLSCLFVLSLSWQIIAIHIGLVSFN